MPKRIGWDDYFLTIADAVAMRADCTRRQVGAVVVEPSTKHIIATGYNGSAPGQPGCLSDGACIRGRHYKQFVAMGGLSVRDSLSSGPYVCGGCSMPWPCAMAVSPGTSYDTGPGSCIALHAEQNATIRAGQRARGAYLFLTNEPCDGCWKLIKGAGYAQVTWYGGQWSSQDDQRNLKPWHWKRIILAPIARLLS